MWLIFQNDDYIALRLGAAASSNMKDTVGALLLGRPDAIPVIEEDPQQASKLAETAYPHYLTPNNGSWQNVNGTKWFLIITIL